VIIDLSLKNGNGLELIKRISALPDHPRMLVCSMHDEKLYAQRAIQAGALGFVHQHQASEKIVTAVERVLEGKLFVSEEVMDTVLTRVLRNGEQTTLTPIEQLTDRELQVFEAIGNGMTVQQIAQSLFLSNKTVETYRDRTKRKLNLRTSAELMHFAIKWVTEHARG
jgi:DNA-binding NarL/FixJ family response regulator